MPVAKFVETMTSYPRRCVITGMGNTPDQGPVWDTNITINGYGRVYITQYGMRRLAKAFGYVPGPDFEAAKGELTGHLQGLAAENADLRERLTRAPDVIERLTHGLRELVVDALAELLPPPDADGSSEPDAAGDPAAGDVAATDDGADQPTA